ncbi:MAG: hypothetical protein IPI73_01360 [Betaproteobacteria bacterium]|nr:hypothetical protein [Betaproteobacteria bacterium]
MRRIVLLSGIFSLLATLGADLFAAPGFLDRGFGAGFGYVRYADSTAAVPDWGAGVAVQPDGKVVVAGATGLEAGIVVLRYNADGTLDDGFADHGVYRWKRENEVSSAHSVIVLPDGKLYVFGYAGSAAKLWLTRLLPDGAPDPGFGAGGTTIATSSGYVADARRVLLDDTGGLVVIWEAHDSTANKIRISRYTEHGQIDDGYAFGAGEVVLDTALFGAHTTLPFGAAFDALGRLLVFASSYNASYNTTLIYRFQRGGYPDALFGDNGMVARQQQNFAYWGRQWTVLTAGATGFILVEWLPDGVRLQKMDPDGQLAPGFGNGGTAQFVFGGAGVSPGNAVVRADGSVLVTGTLRSSLHNEVFVLGVTAAGTLDTRLGTQAPQRIYRGADTGDPEGMTGAGIATASDPGFVVTGAAASNGNADDVLTLRLDADGSRLGAFAGNGRTVWNGGVVLPEAALGLWAQPDGKLLTLNRAGGNAQWRRFLADGRVDSTFGVGGKQALDGDWSGPNVRIFTQADGQILLARQQNGPIYTNVTRVNRYRADTTPDLGFAVGGTLNLIEDAQIDAVRPGLAQLADGRLLLATYGDGGLRLRRTTPDGAPDATFGNGGGIVYPPLYGRPQVGYTVAVQDDGKILLGAATTVITQLPLPQTFVYSDVVARLLPDGSLDPSFGLQGGVVPIQIENARDPQILRIIPLPSGKIVVAGNITRYGAQQFFFLRLNADGSMDTDYGDHTDGADGPGPFIWSDVYQTEMRDCMIDAQGRLVIVGEYILAADRSRSTAFAVRFLPNGTIDGAFGGIHQHIFFFERPEKTTAANALALVPNGIVAAGQNADFGLLFKLEADGSAFTPSQPVVEFFNTILNHYFITADAAEGAAIDAGAAGPGWQRTGRGFRAWTAEVGVPPEAQPVCRFYGTPGLGPNSHFYTVDPAECDAVRLDPGWRYEGIAFYSIAPAGGGCPVGMQRVNRLYNNRFAQNDSNHRYVVDPATYNAMQQQGWSAEGLVLCGPVN